MIAACRRQWTIRINVLSGDAAVDHDPHGATISQL
jgi:hypothetical protein